MTIEIESLKALLKYEPDTGLLRWKVDASHRIKAGNVAGWKDGDGYLRVTILGKRYRAHRVAWALQYGEWPQDLVDHKNGNGLDNRLNNLRVVSQSGNLQNLRAAYKQNTTGVLGVSKDYGKYRASITVNGEKHNLGTFLTAEEAGLAYVEAKRLMHPTCTI